MSFLTTRSVGARCARRSAPAALLFALISGLGAQDLGVWQTGAGSIGAAPAKPGALIGEGVPATAPAKAPARLILLTAPNSVVTLGPGAEVSLSTEKDAAGAHLIIALERGAVEVSLGNKGGYRDVLVRGAAMNVRVTGTLFVVERVRRDADYVALVNGHVKVGLRKEVADALGKPGEEVDLLPHQGLGATVVGGLGQIDSLSSRPSVTDSYHSIHDQATGTNGGFSNDSPEVLGNAASAAAGATNGPNSGGIDNTGISGAAPGAPPAGGGPGDINAPLTLTIHDDLGNQIFNSIDHGSLGQQVTETVLSPAPLGAPPGPPHH
jgi:hypothetical protein